MIQINSDGGARGNPGPGAIGIVVRRENEILLKFSARVGENVTNNIAEYEGLLKSIELAKKFDKEAEIFLDSELLVNQLLGKYKVSNPRLVELFLNVQKAQDSLEKIKYVHVSRWDKFQLLADELVNRELDRR